MNRFWTLAEPPDRPWPSPDIYTLAETAMPVPGRNQALTKTIYVSMDPYQWAKQRWGFARWGNEGASIPCHARTVSQVLASNLDGIAPGDFVCNTNGWAEYGLIGEGVARPDYMPPRRLDPAEGKISHALGSSGLVGLSAYVGMVLQCDPKPGETVVVSAASGGVGQIAGQLAKLRGSRVIGIAGTDAKCRYVVEELGFDACVSHLSPAFVDNLNSACRGGLDVYFENVGGAVFQAVLPLLRPGARMTICGIIAHFGEDAPAAVIAAERLAAEARGVRVEGFSVGDYVDRYHAEAVAEIAPLVASGKIKHREDVRVGLEQIPTAFTAMMQGGTFGKTLVRIAPDPTL